MQAGLLLCKVDWRLPLETVLRGMLQMQLALDLYESLFLRYSTIQR